MSHYHGVNLEAAIQDMCAGDPPLFAPVRRRWWQWWWIEPPARVPQTREWHPRRLLACLSWLPDDSACSASVSGGPHYRGWGQDRWLAKYLFDAVQNNTIANMKIAAGKKSGRVKPAIPWPGPDEQQQEKIRHTPKTRVAALPSFFGTKKGG